MLWKDRVIIVALCSQHGERLLTSRHVRRFSALSRGCSMKLGELDKGNHGTQVELLQHILNGAAHPLRRSCSMVALAHGPSMP